MTTRVYRYGLRRPIEGADIVAAQLRAAHETYNRLIEIERDRRDHYEAIRRDHSPDYEAAAREFADAATALRDARAAVRAARTGPGDAAASKKAKIAAKEALSRKRNAAARLRAAREVLRTDSAFVEAVHALDKETHDRVLALYADVVTKRRAIHWATWNLVKQSVDQAAKASRSAPPKFRRWNGEGALAVQVIGKMAAKDLDRNTHVVIEPPPPEAWDESRPRGERMRLRRTILRFRVGSQGPRNEPLWAVFPILYHRPIPSSAVICDAKVVRTMKADRDRWHLCVTVDEPDPPPASTSGVIAVDIGWRDRRAAGTGEGEPPSLRVAYWRDDEGREGEVVVPAWTASGAEKAAAIRSTRDRDLDALRADLLAARDSFSPEAREACATLHAWRSPGRFAALRRFGPEGLGTGAWAGLETWYHRDRHLWQFETGLRRGAIRHRDDVFRREAKRIATGYGTIFLEDFRLPEVIQEPAPEDLPDRDQDQERRENKAHRQRFVAAAGTFRRFLLEAAAKHGARVIVVPAAKTTIRCHECGLEEPWDKWPLHHKCPACGVEFDQDANATRNLLASGTVAVEGRGPLADDNPLRKRRVARFAKRHKKKATASGV